MAKPGTVVGWKLSGEERLRLLALFEPKYARVIADHVTLRSGANSATPLPAHVEARIVGRADDGHSLECLVAEVDGATDRPDGSIYHITWSLGSRRTARESNDALKHGWAVLDDPIPIALAPARF